MRDESKTPEDERIRGMGCGLGLYTLLVLSIGLVGLVGIGMSIYGMFQDKGFVRSDIQAGHEVRVYQLAALRQAGLVGVEEIPGVFHDESIRRDGSIACALMEDRIVRVYTEGGASGWSCQGGDPGQIQGWTIPYDGIESLNSTGDPFSPVELTVRGTNPDGEPTEIVCNFGPEEGGTRMTTQIRVMACLSETP